MTPAPKPKKQKKKRKKRTKAEYRIQEKRMDQLFSILIRLKSNLVCQKTGMYYELTDSGKIQRGLQCCHYYSRRYRNTRWSYDNCYALNAGTHRYFDSDKEMYKQWLIDNNYHTEDSILFLGNKARSTFRGDRSLIETWINQELEKILPGFPKLNYECLKPIYLKLEIE